MTVHSPRHCRVASGVSIVLAMLGASNIMDTVRALEPEAISWRDDYSRARGSQGREAIGVDPVHGSLVP